MSKRKGVTARNITKEQPSSSQDRRFFLRLIPGARSIITFLAGATAKEVADEVVVQPVKNRILQTIRPAGAPTPKALHERLDLVHGLFLASSLPTDCVPPRNWPHKVLSDETTQTYEHEREVMLALSDYLMGHLGIRLDSEYESWLASEQSSLLLLGSGVSNEMTQRFLGLPTAPAFYTRTPEGKVTHLEYSIGKGQGEITRMQYGEWVTRPKKSICDRTNRILAQAEDSSGLQIDDYLLVTRIPGLVKGSTVTVLSGLHGPATRSAERLFKAMSLESLETLAESIGHEAGKISYYQAVFRASKLALVNGSHVADKLELVTTQCPPRRIKIS